MFNGMESEVNKQASKASKAERKSAWRDRLTRYASSDQSVEAFCKSEGVSTASFYGWRSKLRAMDARSTEGAKAPPVPSPFIDLGPINAAPTSSPTEALHRRADGERRASMEVRIELGDGVLLTITRH